ncbi:hypothetical protein MUY27_10790 [Mucilaginibacter sp. RS28]|uniref:Uncharacterized protein n=1 Tax=Mucilaginibacter straminoryzae TaxID=2932774 RepID=A0A9X2BDC5_9SPHI|nr:hypothetical protein [Mucilaginibacter straminoryzae]MCJ8210198.1 hypothetical protein [Mucilaginibacter straminoryzae]
MNITAEQKQNLYHYLDEVFTYRETLNEVYDHILSAAEQYQGDLSFQDTVNYIIKSDFGGSNKFKDLEKSYQSAAKEDVWNQFKALFLKNARITGAFLTLVCLILTCYFKLDIINMPVMLSIFSAYFIIIVGDHFYRPFKAGYLNEGKKQSLYHKAVSEILNFPGRPMGAFFGALGTRIHTTHSNSVLGIILIGYVYVLIPIFILSYYQAFKQDYQLNHKIL